LPEGICAATKTVSPEGFELTYATNALGFFALTMESLQKSILSSDARIVSLSSIGMYGAEFTDPLPATLNSADLLDQYEHDTKLPFPVAFALYRRTKALQVIFTIELHERIRKDSRYKDVTVQCCHPGK
jgi:NAD(P)-dependent dehydrogenase (short-subunit alcohol dehydrogenase family)